MLTELQKKYKFDITLGHYIYLNEADQQPQAEGEQNPDNAQNAAPGANMPNIETPDITAARAALDAKLNKCESDIERSQQVINTISNNLATLKQKLQDSGATDFSKVGIMQKQLISQQIDLENKIFNKAKITRDERIKILQSQSKLIESNVNIPEKYRHLNESNIHMAKIYINSLVGDESWHILHGMVDVKKCFGNSQLLYGKDKKGYFAVCIDQEDFDRMYNALQDMGYTRDVIIDAIMPQIFDRGEFVKKSS